MRDYYFVDANTGSRTPVAQMPTADIQAALNEGFKVLKPTCTEQAIRDRLLLELQIRQMGLQSS